jgi:hypothetical protein
MDSINNPNSGLFSANCESGLYDRSNQNCDHIDKIILNNAVANSSQILLSNSVVRRSGARSVKNKVLYVIGSLTFPSGSSWEFDNCTFINASGSQVLVEPTASLVINHNSELRSCSDNMWLGIKVRPAARLVLINSKIMDAEVGVDIFSDGGDLGLTTVDLAGNMFVDNHIGVRHTLENEYLLSQGVSVYLRHNPWIRNVFGASGNNKAFFTIGLGKDRTLISLNGYKWPLRALDLNNVIVSLGTASFDHSNFVFNHLNGINTQYSILQSNSTQQYRIGSGLFPIDPYLTTPAYGTGYNCSLGYLGIKENEFCGETFFSGVAMNEVNSSQNIIESNSRAYFHDNPTDRPDFKLNISKDVITTENGILIQNGEVSPRELSISEERLNINQNWFARLKNVNGLNIQNWLPSKPQNLYNIKKNHLLINHDGASGMVLTNLSNYDVTANNVRRETARIRNLPFPSIGLYSSNGNSVDSNFVFGPDYDNNNYQSYEFFSSQGNNVRCNFAGYNNVSFYFEGTSDCNFETNNTYIDSYNLFLRNDPIMGEQLHNGNLWSSYSSAYTEKPSLINLSRFFIHDDSYDPSNSTPNYVPAVIDPPNVDWFTLQSGNPKVCDLSEPPGIQFELERGISLYEANPEVEDLELFKHEQAMYLLQKLHELEMNGENIPIQLSNFETQIPSGFTRDLMNIFRLFDPLKPLMDNINISADALGGLRDSLLLLKSEYNPLIYEASLVNEPLDNLGALISSSSANHGSLLNEYYSEREMLNLLALASVELLIENKPFQSNIKNYLRMVFQNVDFNNLSSQDSLKLVNIAWQCPTTGGEIVYLARQILGEPKSFEQNQNCNQPSAQQRPNNSYTNQNPVVLESIEIYDLLGRLIKSKGSISNIDEYIGLLEFVIIKENYSDGTSVSKKYIRKN